MNKHTPKTLSLLIQAHPDVSNTPVTDELLRIMKPDHYGLCPHDKIATVSLQWGENHAVELSSGIAAEVALKNVAFCEQCGQVVGGRAYLSETTDGAASLDNANDRATEALREYALSWQGWLAPLLLEANVVGGGKQVNDDFEIQGQQIHNPPTCWQIHVEVRGVPFSLSVGEELDPPSNWFDSDVRINGTWHGCDYISQDAPAALLLHAGGAGDGNALFTGESTVAARTAIVDLVETYFSGRKGV